MKTKILIIFLIINTPGCLLNNKLQNDSKNLDNLKTCNTSNVSEIFEDTSQINARIDGHLPIISYYARNGNYDCLTKLISLQANVNKLDTYNFYSPLIYSVYSNPKIIELLLDSGAKLNEETASGGNALILAAELGKLENVNFLISRGMNVNHLTRNKGTALMHAAIRGHSRVVEELLINKADPNLVDIVMISPLMHAASNGKIETVSLLIKYNAEVNLKDKDGYSAIMAPSDSKNPNDDHLEIIDLLINAGANVNERNKNGDTALSIAKKRKLSKIISKLESNGALD